MQNKIIEWAKARKIIPNGNVRTQAIKTLEETHELLRALDRKDEAEVQDAIGDIAVTLIIGRYLCDGKVQPIEENSLILEDIMKPCACHLLDEVANLVCTTIEGIAIGLTYDDAMDALCYAARYLGYSVEACLAGAYEVIKDRTGTLLPNGDFVKDTPVEEHLANFDPKTMEVTLDLFGVHILHNGEEVATYPLDEVTMDAYTRHLKDL